MKVFVFIIFLFLKLIKSKGNAPENPNAPTIQH